MIISYHFIRIIKDVRHGERLNKCAGAIGALEEQIDAEALGASEPIAEARASAELSSAERGFEAPSLAASAVAAELSFGERAVAARVSAELDDSAVAFSAWAAAELAAAPSAVHIFAAERIPARDEYLCAVRYGAEYSAAHGLCDIRTAELPPLCRSGASDGDGNTGLHRHNNNRRDQYRHMPFHRNTGTSRHCHCKQWGTFHRSGNP